MPSPGCTDEPVIAVNWLAPLPAPKDTLPWIWPALVNSLPSLDASNATRPVMVPVLVFVMLTLLPPDIATTGASAVCPDSPNRGVDERVPVLETTVRPAAPFWIFSATPLVLSIERPCSAMVPLMIPWFVTVTMLL